MNYQMALRNGDSLANLQKFFKLGRNQHGGVMMAGEDLVNATERNLSLHTDEELLDLAIAAESFLELVKGAYLERHCEDDDLSPAGFFQF